MHDSFFYGASFPASLSAAESEKIVIAAASEAVKCPCSAQLLSFIIPALCGQFPCPALGEETDAKRPIPAMPAGDWRDLLRRAFLASISLEQVSPLLAALVFSFEILRSCSSS